MGDVQAFTPLNGSAGNSATVTGVTGGKRGSRKLKLVTRKQARKLLKKMGRKMRGGDGNAPGGVVTTDGETKDGEGGRRRHGTKKTRRHGRRSLFGLKY